METRIIDDQTKGDSDFVSSVNLRHLSKELKYNYYDCYTQHEGGFELMDGHAKVLIRYMADKILPGKIIEAGSRAEGTMTPSHDGFGYTLQADSDFMYEIDTTGFHTTMTLEDTEHPGFVNLCIDSKEHLPYIFLNSVQENEVTKCMRISPSKLKLHLSLAFEILIAMMKNQQDNIDHDIFEGFKTRTEVIGPAVRLKCFPQEEIFEPECTFLLGEEDELEDMDLPKSLKVREIDVALTIRFNDWPKQASGWLTRERKWPNKSLLKISVDEGFHVVPKSTTKDITNFEWRLSFARVDCILLKSIANTSQCKHCYRIFKCFVKYHLSHPKLVSTYHCKTIFLWTLERFPPDTWTEDNLGHRFLGLLDGLFHALVMRQLPQYYIPSDNLLKKCNDKTDFVDTVCQKLSDMRRHPFSYIYRLGTNAWDDEMQGFTIEEMIHWNEKPEKDRYPTSEEDIFYERNKVTENE
ncbi:uncharacterized protein LOC127718383 [Mytilus californianus]|uniref:uncharacterized protein LOC127718383 n=1 Tax=Mytilus californianus TaxID=6549 RepID=UPI0022458F07|nr:uncharacterized protein LOC127718383 [Mytilus californianus]